MVLHAKLLVPHLVMLGRLKRIEEQGWGPGTAGVGVQGLQGWGSRDCRGKGLGTAGVRAQGVQGTAEIAAVTAVSTAMAILQAEESYIITGDAATAFCDTSNQHMLQW